jgi:hypothetical protein
LAFQRILMADISGQRTGQKFWRLAAVAGARANSTLSPTDRATYKKTE